ncbi:MAG: hypothetical protein U7126_19520 [Microcoleus sp.]
MVEKSEWTQDYIYAIKKGLIKYELEIGALNASTAKWVSAKLLPVLALRIACRLVRELAGQTI